MCRPTLLTAIFHSSLPLGSALCRQRQQYSEANFSAKLNEPDQEDEAGNWCVSPALTPPPPHLRGQVMEQRPACGNILISVSSVVGSPNATASTQNGTPFKKKCPKCNIQFILPDPMKRHMKVGLNPSPSPTLAKGPGVSWHVLIVELTFSAYFWLYSQ